MEGHAVSGAGVLDRLEAAGYDLALEGGEVRAAGPAPPSEDLRALVEENRDGLKAALLLANRPPWLEKLFELWWSGHQTPVRLSGPTGGAETYLVSVSVKNIAAAVAAEIGLDPLHWEHIRPEVEEALGTWEGAA
jgi:hypothetical protein